MERYSRQMLFKPIGKVGQQKISEKHVLILGCGALGSANADNLARAGVGKLTLIDRDYVEISNLQRQQLYTEQDVYNQIPKAIAAKKRLQEINSEIDIEAHVMDASVTSLEPLLTGIDLVMDATDNFDTRFLLNDMLQKYSIPWIFGSCVGSTGMSYTILPNQTPCLRCLLDAIPVSGATCDSVGIISPAVQMVVAHQTTEALKILIENQKSLRTSLVTFDLWNNHYHMMKVDRAKKQTCPACGENPNYPALDYQSTTKSEVLCGRNTVQIRTSQKQNLNLLKERLERIAPVKVNDFLISIEYESYRLVFFQDGRTLIHGTNSIEKAKSIYYQLAG
ncbi:MULTISPECIES: MoeB/ThiF family adenylyltransferase [Bacillaceae]|uniref:Thiamine biosynthesis protein MoeB n=1 Tax=Oceanobacillus caeni TaxID=405946 RepID=A0ABR5MJM8_9BACI|nr:MULTISPECIES: MoeB/ThiF family adenylyltransferase [Bacillaceae]KKE78178.1 thiamine biosynthesis protein MoeB [Bacilli bacterium VT-13-104]PZD84753.1 thiamine biosynthesis protein MoeB [Bacilli bacterium]KPH75813.1 thiamine biosynthesis protein MoeB [Oceanobacillus caeni]MBU8791964.1 ThiF family adenylyltransferase [Oceanobacillus caeni]MED4473706.1 MoeB/ThiF family adenylyltransferase [Oceanobacillus caeni]